jgi:hypothetical protein
MTTSERTDLKMPPRLAQQFDETMRTYGFKTRTKTLAYLLNQSEKKLAEMPVATYETIVRHQKGGPDEKPVAIVGPPSSGKSYTMGLFIKECFKQDIPFILFDILTEHPEIPKVMNYYDFMGFRFTGHAQFRVTFPRDAALRKAAMRQILDALERAIGEGRLTDYVLAFEEAYEYGDSMLFLKFLSKIRKWARLTVVVSTDPRPFAPFCAILRPLPKP